VRRHDTRDESAWYDEIIMAETLAVLGATAAALQLASQAFELVKFLSDIYGKVQDAIDLAKDRILHLEQLIDICKLIAKTSSLQTAEVQKALVACLQTALKLHRILKESSAEEHGRLRRFIKSIKLGIKDD